MTIWLAAHLPPHLCVWVTERFGINAVAIRDLGLRDSGDLEIFRRAKDAGAIIMSKDRDFVDLAHRLGAPPRVIWLRCGNTSNLKLRALLEETMADAVKLLGEGISMVEIEGSQVR